MNISITIFFILLALIANVLINSILERFNFLAKKKPNKIFDFY